MDKMDYKKAEKAFYQPSQKPALITVPSMRFIGVDGRGDPNEPEGAYQQAVGLLYALSYGIKMSKMGGRTPPGYFEYVVPPLEGLWWMPDGQPVNFEQKERFCWTAMIRQPEFVTQAVLEAAVEAVQKKDPGCNAEKARLFSMEEGLCMQVMHLGSYDEEPATLERMDQAILEAGLEYDFDGRLPDGSPRRHHEIYLSDPRRCTPGRLRTVLRTPVRQRTGK